MNIIMGEVIPDELLPPNTQYEWGTLDGESVIHAIHVDDGFDGGTFLVHHGILPSRIETPFLLGASGMTPASIASALYLSKSVVDDYNLAAFDVLRTPPKGRGRIHMAVGRLCLPGSALEVIQPIRFSIEPDDLSIQVANLLAQGREWREVEAESGFVEMTIKKHIKVWYSLQDGRVSAAPFLLHLYGSSHLDPVAVVAKQARPGPTPESPSLQQDQEVVPPYLLPPHTEFEWSSIQGVNVIDAIYVKDGKMSVRHGLLPPRLETPVLLRAAGVEYEPMEALPGIRSKLTKYYHLAFDLLGTPALRAGQEVKGTIRRLPAAIARLCQPGNVLEVVQPITFPAEPVEEDIEVLRSLGLGNGWDAVKGRARVTLREHFKRWYDLQPARIHAAPLLLHSYWAGLLDPESVVAAQDQLEGGKVMSRYQPPKIPWLSKVKPPEPFVFTPFDDGDEDQATSFRILPGSTLDVSKILSVTCSYGAFFEVADAGELPAATGEHIPASTREKLAIILLAFGGTVGTVDAYFLHPQELRKFGVDNPVAAARLACRALLVPCTAPRIQLEPKFLDTADLLFREEAYTPASQLSSAAHQLAQIYELRHPSMLMILAHAAGQLL